MKRITKHRVSADSRLNPQLQEEVAGVRGSMTQAAEDQELPERFEVQYNNNNPTVTITDKTTGRQTVVPLFAYSNIRKSLNDLFGEGK